MQRAHQARHVVVVMHADRARTDDERGTLRRILLKLVEIAVRPLEIGSGTPVERAARTGQRHLRTGAVLAVLFEWLARKEVLQKLHPRATKVRGDVELDTGVELAHPLADEP